MLLTVYSSNGFVDLRLGLVFFFFEFFGSSLHVCQVLWLFRGPLLGALCEHVKDGYFGAIWDNRLGLHRLRCVDRLFEEVVFGPWSAEFALPLFVSGPAFFCCFVLLNDSDDPGALRETGATDRRGFAEVANSGCPLGYCFLIRLGDEF